MEEQVKEALELVRPSLQAHGGDVTVIEVAENEGEVYVELQGACQGCKGALMTLKMGIERILKEKVPGVQEVIAVNM
ncbi:hypothetical protein AZF37_05300 [endosymbiont 'TC1' of Trimyema compressum]|uniref:NifU family protein n=1 Tax=endosymbiont 'TC1' of Trimyema compressum TaxID=243899 RepID=UPI0007F13F24|nr:NifU family protein [endosymbiont 'TC1' of Trimyema compressum]AMP20669.1 hypothetical protein AZF37_05300 [endosymbiont 'TC1' of Trimyema compressum]